MTPSLNSTSATRRSRPAQANSRTALAVLLLAAAALLLRSLRLEWQPLWWDEGYSVYFATEPPARMLELTAADIHPPFYYALLHGWLAPWGRATPAALRWFSVLAGAAAMPLIAWLAALLYPARRRPALVAAALLALSPIHLFYSQEVRMYGLALALGLAASALLLRLVQRPSAGRAAAYAATAAALLYTLYYGAFLLLAHALWAGWVLRRQRRGLLTALAAFVAAGLAFLPWALYTGGRLVSYVEAKVVSDQDAPLGPLAYLWRHLLAFTGGHLAPDAQWQLVLRWLGAAGALLALALLALELLDRRAPARPNAPAFTAQERSSDGALLLWTLLPALIAFLLNLRLPFFPTGGERVLLLALPYFLLLLARGIDAGWRQQRWSGGLAGGLLAAAAVGGIVTFYTLPRYAEHDYRPLIGQVVQQGRPEDTYFAIFPWQLGYWRAYAADAALDPGGGPQAQLASDAALEWGPEVAALLDGALERGTLWFPAPLSFGSTLPGEIESHLSARAANLENRWLSPATRLSAWATIAPAPLWRAAATFNGVQLINAGFNPPQAVSANQPLRVDLAWQLDASPTDYFVTLRLLDSDGRIWAERGYAPPGSLAGAAAGNDAGHVADHAGLIVPAGLPPDTYALAVGLGRSADQALLRPSSSGPDDAPLVTLGAVQVQTPDAALPPVRLPIQTLLEPPVEADGLALLGFAGVQPGDLFLAGEPLDVTLFFQSRTAAPPPRQIYLSLLARDGGGAAGWEGWPLPNYLTQAWPEGALVQAPAAFYLPADLPSGTYRLVTGLVDPVTGAKSDPTPLSEVSVARRPAVFEPQTPPTALDPPVLFGSHAALTGYSLQRQNSALSLALYWSIRQTLLPPHHIFVHLDEPGGETMAQDDGPPATADGPAPSGSWLPGEFLVTQHTLALPAGADGDAAAGWLLRVGLYNPDGNVRLPASREGAPAGDSATLPLR